MKRELGSAITISIATAVPLEKLITGESSHGATHIYLNLLTLFRNYHSSFEDVESVDRKDLLKMFLEELQTIEILIAEQMPTPMTPVLYLPSYKSVPSRMKYAVLKSANTDRQKRFFDVQEQVIKWLLKQTYASRILRVDCDINGGNLKALVVTHLPIDLLSSGSFRSLHLLESNTGNIKAREEWGSKLTNPKKYANLPFCALTLQVIGDNSNMFSSAGAKYTKTLMAVAEANNWHPATKLMKIRYDLRKWKDRLSASILDEMASARLR